MLAITMRGKIQGSHDADLGSFPPTGHKTGTPPERENPMTGNGFFADSGRGGLGD